jgi:hypothetical protein
MLAFGGSGRRRAPPNNSFGRSGMSLDVIRKIEGCSAILPARSIRALDTLRIKRQLGLCGVAQKSKCNVEW